MAPATLAALIVFPACSGGGGGGGDSLPSSAVELRFGPVASSAAVGVPLAEFAVQIVDEVGVIVTAGTASITVAVDELDGTTDASLVGETTQDSTAGVALFSGLSIDRQGEFVLRAEGGGLEPGSSELIGVGAWGQIHATDYAHRVIVVDDRIWITNDEGIFRSDDGGETFEEADGALPRMEEIAVDPVDPDILYAGNSFPNPYAYKTTDAGANWTDISTPFDPGQDGAIALAVDPADSTHIFGGDAGATPCAFASTDGGVSWFDWNGSMPTAFVYDILAVPTNPTVVFAAAGGGIYRRAVTDPAWDEVEFGGAQVRSLAFDPGNLSRVVAGAGLGEIYLTENGGDTWTTISSIARGTPNTAFEAVGIDAAGTIYAGSDEGLYVSDDSGASWAVIDIGDGSYNPIFGLHVDPVTVGTVYAATQDGVFMTVVGGQ